MDRVQRLSREGERCSKDMEQQARSLIESHSLFAGRRALFEIQCGDNILVVRGSVPTFYLKQILQSVLKNVDGVRWVDNQVTVDWSDGLIGPRPS
jgi:hypothetical protein